VVRRAVGVDGSVAWANLFDAAGLVTDTLLPRDSISVKDAAYGAVGNSNGTAGNGTDDTVAIQAAMTAAATANKTVVVPPGTYRVTASLLCDTNTSIRLTKVAWLVKDWTADNALIRNRVLATKCNDVRVTGEGKLGVPTGSTTVLGNIVDLYGDRIHLRDFTIDGYNKRGVALNGNLIRCHHLTLLNPGATTGAGGIRFNGGDRFVATACHVDSGDDALQFVPVGAANGVDITNSAYIGCTGSSSAAKFMAVVLSALTTPGNIVMSASIKNVSFIGCHGSGQTAMKIQNENSSGVVRGVSVIDCSVDMGAAAADQFNHLYINSEAGTGGMSKLAFRGWTILNPRSRSLIFSGLGTTSDVLFEDLHLSRGVIDSTTSVASIAGYNVRVIGGVFDGGGVAGEVLAVGIGTIPTANVLIRDAHIVGCANGANGAIFVNATTLPRTRIESCTFEEYAGQTAAKAVKITANPTATRVTGNDMSALTTAAANRVSDLATGTMFRDNEGYVTAARGTTTIVDTAATVVVTHGLVATPVVVSATPRGNEAVWVSARSATTFTISRVGTAGALAVDWRADV